MADQQVFEALFRYQNDGIKKTENEVKDFTKALNDAKAAGKLTEDQVKSLSQAMERSQAKFTKAAQAIQGTSQQFEDLFEKVQAAQGAIRKLNLEMTAGKVGTLPDFDPKHIDDYTEAQIRGFHEVQQAANTTGAQLIANKVREFDEIRAARVAQDQATEASAAATQQNELARIRTTMQAREAASSETRQMAAEDHRFEQAADEKTRKAELDRLREAIQARHAASAEAREQQVADGRLADAADEKNRKAELDRLKGVIQARAEAQRTEEDRVKRMDAVHARALAENEKRDQAALKQTQALAEARDKAQERSNKATDDLAYESEKADLKGVERATEDVTRAKGRLRDAEKAVQAARSAGDVRAETQALNAQTQATQELTAAERRLSGAQQDRAASVESLRYAQFDVAQATLGVAAAVTASAGAIGVAFAEYETASSNVAQMTGLFGDSVDPLIAGLNDLGKVIPVPIAELQNMAAIAGQLGINGADNILAFTNALSTFSVISDVDPGQAAEAIAKIANLTGDTNYSRIAASIAEVEVNSAATTEQLIRTTQEMARVGNVMGLTAAESVGLAGAFSSLAIPPEQARSVMVQFNNVIAGMLSGGEPERLANFAALMGTTEEAVLSLYKSDPSAFFTNFLTSLNGVDNVAYVLDELGLAGQRATPVFTTLASRTEVLTQALSDAETGYGTMGAMQARFAEFADDLASRWTRFTNAMVEFASKVGPVLLPAFEMIMSTVEGLADVVGTFAMGLEGNQTAELAVRVAAIATGFLFLRGGIALATGTMLAFHTAAQGAGIRVGMTGVSGLSQAFRLLTGSASAATASLSTTSRATWISAAASAQAAGTASRLQIAMLRTAGAARIMGAALLAAGKAAFWMMLIAAVISLLTDFQGSMYAVGDAGVWLVQAWGNIAKGIVDYTTWMMNVNIHSFNAIINGINLFRSAIGAKALPLLPLANVADNLHAINMAVRTGRTAVRDWQSQWKKSDPVQDALDAANAALGAYDDFVDDATVGTDDFGDSLGGAGDKAKDAGKGIDDLSKKVRTLTDYAGELSDVFSRSFELRFARISSLDTIAQGFSDIAKANQEAASKIRDLRIELMKLRAEGATLSSDLSQQKYFLKVAEEYGDAARAEAIRARILELESKIAENRGEGADKARELREQEDAATRGLKGNTDAARGNRKVILDLLGSYQEHLRVLAATGMSQGDLAKAAAVMKAEFMEQGKALGFSSDELAFYGKAFDDFGKIVRTMPRNVTVEFDGDPASTAMREFFAKAVEQAQQAGKDIGDALGAGLGGLGGFGGGGGGMPDLPTPEPSTKPVKLLPINDGSQIVRPGEVHIYDPEFDETDFGTKWAMDGYEPSKPLKKPSLFDLINDSGDIPQYGTVLSGEFMDRWTKGLERGKPGEVIEREVSDTHKWGLSGANAGLVFGSSVKVGYDGEDLGGYTTKKISDEPTWKGRGTVVGHAFGGSLKTGIAARAGNPSVDVSGTDPQWTNRGTAAGGKFGAGVKSGAITGAGDLPGAVGGDGTKWGARGTVVGHALGAALKTGVGTGAGDVTGAAGTDAQWTNRGTAAGGKFGAGLKTGTGTGAGDLPTGVSGTDTKWGSTGTVKGSALGKGIREAAITGTGDLPTGVSGKDTSWTSRGTTAGGKFGAGVKTGTATGVGDMPANVKGADSVWTTGGTTAGGKFGAGVKTGITNAKVDGPGTVSGTAKSWTDSGSVSGKNFGEGAKTGFKGVGANSYMTGIADDGWTPTGNASGVNFATGMRSGFKDNKPGAYMHDLADNGWTGTGNTSGVNFVSGYKVGYEGQGPGSWSRGKIGTAQNWKDQGYARGKDYAAGFKQGFNDYGLKIGSGNNPRIGGANMWTGGFTGRGGMYEPAGTVHRGEYVIPKRDVNQATGLPYADALGRLQRGSGSANSYAAGGYVGGSGGTMVAEMDPTMKRYLRQIAERVGVTIGAESIGRATTAANRSSSRRGAKV